MLKEVRFRLIKHITFLDQELTDYPAFKTLTWKEYSQESAKRRNVERWIENIINSSIDIAKIILRSEGKQLGDSYKETVRSVALVVGFDEASMRRLSEWVKLRNIISHEYLDVRWSSISRFLAEGVDQYQGFLATTRAYLQRHLSEEQEEDQP